MKVHEKWHTVELTCTNNNPKTIIVPLFTPKSEISAFLAGQTSLFTIFIYLFSSTGIPIREHSIRTAYKTNILQLFLTVSRNNKLDRQGKFLKSSFFRAQNCHTFFTVKRADFHLISYTFITSYLHTNCIPGSRFPKWKSPNVRLNKSNAHTCGVN